MNLFVLNIVIFHLVLVNAEHEWWKTMSLYQIYPRSFKDSNGDGVGDLKGIESKLQHLVDSKFDAFWLSPIYPSPMKDFGYDISNFREIDSVYGTMADFDNLLEKAHNLSLKVIMDLVPNHSSDKHEWFQKSLKKIEPYTDYYVWHEGKIINGTRYPPNNWVSVFYGSAWTWNEERQAYYLHQFLAEQPDLNYRNPHVVEEMKNIMRFWLDKGVDGFRVDAVSHLVEAKELYDEPLSGITNDSNSMAYTNHMYTTNLLETYEMVQQWRNVIDEYKTKNESRVMMLEVYGSIKQQMDYYCYGASFPFNFIMIFLNQNSTAGMFKSVLDKLMDSLPIGSTTNWVTGNHDQSRVATRHGREYSLVMNAMIQLLPGVAVTYNGDEIGMEDTWYAWRITIDPKGCRVGKKLFASFSRDPARSPFQWDSTTSAGFSSNSKTWLLINGNYNHINLATEKTADKSFYKDFLKITNLRQWPAVKKGGLNSKLLNNNVFAFSGELNGEKSVYVIANFGYNVEAVNLQAFKNVPTKLQVYLTIYNNINVKDGDVISSEELYIDPRSGLILVSV